MNDRPPKRDQSPFGDEANRLGARMGRYARVGTGVGGVAMRLAGARLLGLDIDQDRNAHDLARALGGLKGPIMKVAQLLSTIPEAIPPEYAAELATLQAQAPAMGWGFTKRRMAAELGPDWRAKFAHFERTAAASASLGQVHRASHHDGRALAVKLQYPDMESAVVADLNQLGVVFAVHRRMNPAVDTSEVLEELSARLREELDYELEAAHTRLYGLIFAADDLVRVPEVITELSTGRLLTMTWLEGRPLFDYREGRMEDRNQIARAMFRGWWYPFSHYGVIHGDPHLGNYSIFAAGLPPDGVSPAPDRAVAEDSAALAPAGGINLLDYGCMRTFAPKFVGGVVDLYRGLLEGDRARVVHAYETWGFVGLSNELIDILNIWARFIYGPLLDDRVRAIAEGVAPGEYGRKEAFVVHKGLREKGPVRVPREFVFMDRAAIGLGGVFLHLDARLNYYRLFNETIENFELESVRARQREVFEKAKVPLPDGVCFVRHPSPTN